MICHFTICLVTSLLFYVYNMVFLRLRSVHPQFLRKGSQIALFLLPLLFPELFLQILPLLRQLLILPGQVIALYPTQN